MIRMTNIICVYTAADVDLLPFGSGRTRPIPDGLYAYAQQMSRDEISTFLERRYVFCTCAEIRQFNGVSHGILDKNTPGS